MKLYSYWRSSASYRVRIVLALKRIEYEYVPVDISKKTLEQHTGSYEKINAMRQVPVLEWLEDGREQRLTQSVAICEYLDEMWPSPPLFPEHPLARARVREAVEIVNSGIQPLQNLSRFGSEEGSAARAIERGLAVLEHMARSHGSPYFAGDIPSLADVFIVPQLFSARRFWVDVEHCPRLLDIERRALSNEAFALARPERQPDAPRDGQGAERRP